MISIIVPIYNEEGMLSRHYAGLRKLSREAELIFVDGGSKDGSVDAARRQGKVFHSKKGRAAQMNCGASEAGGDILLFLHADNIIFSNVLESIKRKIAVEGNVGGCLTQRIDNKALIYRFIEAQGNLRARFNKIFYGDQGIFVKKEIFFKLGGFPDVPIMEDVFFTRKLRRAGKTAVLPDKIISSARRWERRGIIKSALLYNLIILLFWLKAPLNKIKQLYEDIR